MSDTPSMGDLFGGETAGGWLNMPRASIDSPQGIDIAVLGIGSATPYPVGSYCHDAPDAIRAARSWPTILEQHDFDLFGVEPSAGVLPEGVVAADFGNLDTVADAAPGVTESNRAMIRGAVTSLLDAGSVPFVLGGDDSVPIPVLESYCGFDGGPISILQIDAHIDWRDDVGGETQGLSSNMRRASEMAHVGRIVQLGARGIGSARKGDVQAALDYGVALHTMRNLIEPDGIARAVADLPEGVPVYIALDVDSMDPVVMPAVIGAAQGGLSYWQMMQIFEAVTARAPVCGFNMVELMPPRDVNGQGALMASRLGLSMLGLIARQRAAAK
ncbi:MAG: arginase family protein [Pseudomonadota bacterium]|nr:arginase family protein [Pseudomonadota bacterium]MEC9145624.1 arginase family protein [Pseudomonadota bacterium]